MIESDAQASAIRGHAHRLRSNHPPDTQVLGGCLSRFFRVLEAVDLGQHRIDYLLLKMRPIDLIDLPDCRWAGYVDLGHVAADDIQTYQQQTPALQFRSDGGLWIEWR